MRAYVVVLFVCLIPCLTGAGVLRSRFNVGGGRTEFQTDNQHQYLSEASGYQFSLTLASPLLSHLDVRAVSAFGHLESNTESTSPTFGALKSISLCVEAKLDLFRQDARSNFYAFIGIGYNRIWWKVDSPEPPGELSDGPSRSGHIKTWDDRFLHSFGVGAEIRVVRTFGIFIEWRQKDLYPLRDDYRLRTITIGLFV